jgi:hypothetical protein
MPRIESLGYAFVIHGRGHGSEGTLVQTDWDYPATAEGFGWSLRRVQKRGSKVRYFARRAHGCDHRGTDGTVKCRDCGIEPTDFIRAADEFLNRIAR